MQVQHAGVIDYPTAREINQISPLISWSGDVRNDTAWHELMGAAGAITLLSNDEDVEKLKSLGYKAEYLQVGFHIGIHNPANSVKGSKLGKIVFVGNNCSTSGFPLAHERQELVRALKSEYGDDFAVYGANWEECGIVSNPIPERDCSKIYSQYDICINHSNYLRRRYTSNRLFYILASGSFCLSHEYPGMDDGFIDGKHLVAYKSIPDLIDKCKIWLDPLKESERSLIAKQGCDHVHANCTWNERVKQLIPIIKQYYPTAMFKNDEWLAGLRKVQPEKHYSQFGEEPFFGYIFNSIGTTNKYFVDLGAGDGHYLSNTKLLKDEYGWTGLMIDADNHGNSEVKQHFITATNILELLSQYKVPKEFDFLSIDLDGNDYWVLQEILTEYKPRLIVAEFNGTIGNGIDKVMQYNEAHTWGNDDYYGASFEAFKRLGKENGYATIWSYVSTNIYLLNKDELANRDADFGITYTPQQYHPHNPNGAWINF